MRSRGCVAGRPGRGERASICRIDYPRGSRVRTSNARPPPVSSAPLHASIAWADPARQTAFAAWLVAISGRGLITPTLRPASSDASFRRYLRADLRGGGSVIVMDAPPAQEDVRPFVHVAGLIECAGLHAPRVLEADVVNGFLLLDDLGDQLYLAALQAAQAEGDAKRADALMRDAIAALVTWQLRLPGDALPPCDDALLRRELALFPEWCVVRELGVTWTAQEQAQWQAADRKSTRLNSSHPRLSRMPSSA